MQQILFPIFYSSHTLLSANGGIGFLLLVLMFLFCFALVHIARLAKFGWQQTTKKPKKEPPKPTAKKEKAPAPPQEPIYYIVERKQRRAKPRYGEPKEIRFKD